MALDYLPSPSWAVIYGETPSADRWSELGENDDALATGAGWDDDVLLARHIPDGGIPSVALAQSFLRGRRKNSTTDISFTDYKIQAGWGYLPGDGTPGVNQNTNFPEAFTAAPLIVISYAGARLVSDGTPSSLQDFSASVADSRRIAAAAKPTTTSFESSVIDAAGNTSNLVNYAYAWIAIGP